MLSHHHNIYWICYVTCSKQGKYVPGPPTMDQLPPMCHQKRRTNKQHSRCHPNSHTMVRHLRIWNWGLHWQRPRIVIENPSRMVQWNHTQYIRITSIKNMNQHYYTTTGTRFTHLGTHGHLPCTCLDTQGILWPGKCIISQRCSPLDSLDPRQ